MATLAVVPGATFARITNGPIATDKGSFTRCVWGDFNNNGFLDLFVNDYGGPNVFYRNNGDRTFTKLTGIGLAATADFHTGTAAADYDNDGYLDLIDLAGIQAPTPRFNTLYHNDGTRRFTPVSAGGVTNLPGFFDAVAWADYDNDGFVDLFITENGTSTDTGGTNRLWHNNGDGTFTEITAGPFATDVGVGWATLWSDYDNDGFMDLIVLNLSNDSTNFLYHNNGNGTFSRVLTNAIATDHWITGAEAGAWGDFDNDGWPDLFVTDNRGARNRLYHNNGDGSFSNVAAGPMLTPPAGTSPRGCTWGDYDNDGFIDLFVTDANSRNRLYHNNGDGTFGEITTGPQVNDPALSGLSSSCAWADFDNDGFLDLFVTLGASSRNVSNALYHNSGNSNAWLEIKCVGTVANRSAIGTKVRLVTTIAGKSVSQLREINTGGGWNSVPLIAHFGLGDATKVETLRLEWPSGTVQELHNVAPRQILTLTEPPRLTATKVSGQPQFTLKGGRNMTYDIEASSNPTTWAALSTVTITNLSGTALITDPAGTVAKHKFYRAVTH